MEHSRYVKLGSVGVGLTFDDKCHRHIGFNLCRHIWGRKKNLTKIAKTWLVPPAKAALNYHKVFRLLLFQPTEYDDCVLYMCGNNENHVCLTTKASHLDAFHASLAQTAAVHSIQASHRITVTQQQQTLHRQFNSRDQNNISTSPLQLKDTTAVNNFVFLFKVRLYTD